MVEKGNFCRAKGFPELKITLIVSIIRTKVKILKEVNYNENNQKKSRSKEMSLVEYWLPSRRLKEWN